MRRPDGLTIWGVLLVLLVFLAGCAAPPTCSDVGQFRRVWEGERPIVETTKGIFAVRSLSAQIYGEPVRYCTDDNGQWLEMHGRWVYLR